MSPWFSILSRGHATFESGKMTLKTAFFPLSALKKLLSIF
jgi:hypothetical protein